MVRWSRRSWRRPWRRSPRCGSCAGPRRVPAGVRDQPQKRLVEIIGAGPLRQACRRLPSYQQAVGISSNSSQWRASSITWLDTSRSCPSPAVEQRPQLSSQERIQSDRRLVEHEHLGSPSSALASEPRTPPAGEPVDDAAASSVSSTESSTVAIRDGSAPARRRNRRGSHGRSDRRTPTEPVSRRRHDDAAPASAASSSTRSSPLTRR